MTTKNVLKKREQLQTLTVRPEEKGWSLLDFLSTRRQESKRSAKALLDERRVLVNERRVWMAKHLLRSGDVILIQQPPSPARKKVPILFRNEDYLVLDKPPGLLSNGPRSAETLAREMLRLPHLQAAHRLDRDTSGCLLFALHEQAMEQVVELFRSRKIRKVYMALLAGRLTDQRLRLTEALDGKSARTDLENMQSSKEASLVKIGLVSGRTHQIRRHLAAIGHPVLGDKMYAGSIRVDPRITRQLLHASELSFVSSLSGEAIKARAPLPPDFRVTLRRLGLS